MGGQELQLVLVVIIAIIRMSGTPNAFLAQVMSIMFNRIVETPICS